MRVIVTRLATVVTAGDLFGKHGTNGALLMTDWYSQLPPCSLLILGIILLFSGVIWTCTGKTWDRYGGWVYRTQEPKRFWWAVAMYYLVGIGLIGFYLYLTN